jgi:hypothetical protein
VPNPARHLIVVCVSSLPWTVLGLHLFHYLLNIDENPRIILLVRAVVADVALLLEGATLVVRDP